VISVTKAAAEQINASSNQEGIADMKLRLSVRKKPDGTFDYLMGFDDVADGDISIEDNGAALIVSEDDKRSLEGTTVDYVELAEGKFHFIFSNPNDENYTPSTK
jgi:iron-sulfur cluster assembly protein